MPASEMLGPEEIQEKVKAFREALKQPEWDARLRAVNKIGILLSRLKHKDLIFALAEALKDEHWAVRSKVVYWLGESADEGAAPFLAEALSDNEHWVARDAARALLKIGKAIQGKTVEEKYAKAIQLLVPYFHPLEDAGVVRHALEAVVSKEVDAEGARLLTKVMSAKIRVQPIDEIIAQEPESECVKAMQLVAPHFQKQELPSVVRRAFLAALQKKITAENVRAYVEELRARRLE